MVFYDEIEKKMFYFCWVTIDALFFGRRKNRQMCQRI